MRAFYAVVILSCAMAGLGQAEAADLHAPRTTTALNGVPVRAGQLFVYDYQPGVEVRAYWARPWQNRHYFPFTGKKPKVGRHENLSAKRPAPKPAESFYREWSTVSLYPPRAVMPPPDNTQPLILNESTHVSAPLK